MECVKKEGVGIFNFLHARGMDFSGMTHCKAIPTSVS